MRQSRMPQVGDLLFVTCPNVMHTVQCTCRAENRRHVGLVREIIKDSYGHQRNVHIEWSTIQPVNYRDEHGYAGTNIDKIRSEFTVIREGRNIP